MGVESAQLYVQCNWFCSPKKETDPQCLCCENKFGKKVVGHFFVFFTLFVCFAEHNASLNSFSFLILDMETLVVIF